MSTQSTYSVDGQPGCPSIRLRQDYAEGYLAEFYAGGELARVPQR